MKNLHREHRVLFREGIHLFPPIIKTHEVTRIASTVKILAGLSG